MSNSDEIRGPWSTFGSSAVMDSESMVVCKRPAMATDEEWERSAALIASAPTLRDDLGRAADLVRELISNEHENHPNYAGVIAGAKAFLADLEKRGAP